MMLGRMLMIAVTLFSLTAAMAQDEPAPTPTPDLSVVRLLEEVPNYAVILANQWSEGVGAVGTTAESDWDNYGRLVDTGSPQSLTVSDCILLALKYNTGLQVERLGPLSARAGVRRARSVFDPAFFSSLERNRAVVPSDIPFYTGNSTAIEQNLNANVGLRKVLLSGGQTELKWTNRRYFSNSAFQSLNPDYITGLSLSLSQPLLRNFGLHYATILVRVAQTTELQSIRAYEAKVATIVKGVEDAYWALVRSMENVRVQEQALAAGKELERQNRGKFEVGALPRTSVLEAESVVAQRQSLLIAVQNAVTIHRDNLRALLNARSPETDALILLEPSEQPSVEPAKFDLDTSLQLAREKRPELQVAQLDVHAKALSLKAAENQLLPNFDAVAGIGVNGLSGRQLPVATPNPEDPFSSLIGLSRYAGGYGDSLNLLTDGRFYSYTAGVVLNIPISNAQSRAGYATARIDLERARLNFQALQQQVTLEVKTAISNLQTDLRSIEATRVARGLAEENVRNQQARYDVGLATTKDLLDFQDQQTRAQVAAILAVIQYNTDLAELRRVEGTLLRTRNIVLDVVAEERAPWWARF
jgi:outer membrane protein TolC